MNKRGHDFNQNVWIDVFKIDSSIKNILLHVEVALT